MTLFDNDCLIVMQPKKMKIPYSLFHEEKKDKGHK